MLLSQQAQLLRLDERRAVVRVAGTWMAMVQSRLPLLEKAVASALGSPRQLTLEAGEAERTPQPLPTAPAKLDRRESPASGQSSSPHPGDGLSSARLQTDAIPVSITTLSVLTPDPVSTATGEDVVRDRAPSPVPLRSPLNEKARNLADFFGGEVIEDFEDVPEPGH
jgi:DNA polymerase-3 subunit gamma/tau